MPSGASNKVPPLAEEELTLRAAGASKADPRWLSPKQGTGSVGAGRALGWTQLSSHHAGHREGQVLPLWAPTPPPHRPWGAEKAGPRWAPAGFRCPGDVLPGRNAEQRRTRPREQLCVSCVPSSSTTSSGTCAATSRLLQSSCPTTEPHSCSPHISGPQGLARDSRRGAGWRWGLWPPTHPPPQAPGTWSSLQGGSVPCCIPERWTRPRLLPCLAAAPAPTLARENAGRRGDRRLPPPHAGYLEVR
ncbi:uncharacterized protein [Physeter macrocephalus]|nr:uncharacterized protein LOC114486629 isoform X2 [Physeter catodon]|eukprot:XP_028348194.1 uncharacterized protein LOC114486629 isoform X2 [Physeter catodon]